MHQLGNHLTHLTAQAESALASFDSLHWHASRGEGKWTRLQILGHLIDSAANNHQRFVRALIQPRLEWPGYDQVAHVTVQHYIEADPAVCLLLWSSYNRHLAHIMRQMTDTQESKPCSIDLAPEMTLADLVRDYIAHLEHHLRQLLDTQSIDYSGMPWPPSDPNRQWPV